MNYQDLRTLQLLEEIDRETSPTQRDLARKLNVSLGLVNSFLKRLAKKGYLKITTIPKNRVKYILTPKGAAEKTKLTYGYIQHSYHYYVGARRILRQLFGRLEKDRVSKVVFYGISHFTEIAFISLQESAIEVVALVDDHRIGETFMNRRIHRPEMLAMTNFDKVIITSLDTSDQIMERLSALGIPDDRIVELESAVKG